MLEFNLKQYKSFSEIFTDYPNLASFSNILHQLGCNQKKLEKFLIDKDIQAQEVICKPSGKKMLLYSVSDLKELVKAEDFAVRNDIVPKDYITEKQMLEKFNLTHKKITDICFFNRDFRAYSEIFIIKNRRTRFYLLNSVTEPYYKGIIDRYFNPNRKRGEIVYSGEDGVPEFNDFRLGKTKFYKHHKIKIDKTILCAMLNTDSPYFKMIVDIYKRCSSQVIEDVTLYELHHIVPRFYVRQGNTYSKINDMSNLIYLPPNIHFVIHFLELKCARPEYKNEFLCSACVKTCTLNSEQMDEKYITEITDLLIKAFIK